MTLDELKTARDQAAEHYHATLDVLRLAYTNMAALDIALAQLSGSAELIAIGARVARAIREHEARTNPPDGAAATSPEMEH